MDEEVDLEGDIAAEEPIADPLRELNIKGTNSPLDELLSSQVEALDGRYVCLICGKKSSRSDSIRRHMREIHLSSDQDYHCPPCNKYFKNRRNIYNHIKAHHRSWNGVNYDKFRVNSKPRPTLLQDICKLSNDI